MAADRWGARASSEQKQLTPEQFEASWQNVAVKLLRGDAITTESGPYFVRCGRNLGFGKYCLARLGHSSACTPKFKNICDAPLPKENRCVLNAGHKSKCMPVFPR
jgi:hypothetical protein